LYFWATIFAVNNIKLLYFWATIVAVNNIKLLGIAFGGQKLVSSALFSSYKIFYTAVNSNNPSLYLHVNCPIFFSH
jgi:hypothetical protein